MTGHRSVLASAPLFQQLPEQVLARLEGTAVERHYAPGTEIVREGDGGIALFVIVSGSAVVTRGHEMTHRRILREGDTFGELALVDGARRTASVKATSPLTCLAITRWDFMAEVHANPDLAVELVELLTRRVRELEHRVDDLEADG